MHPPAEQQPALAFDRSSDLAASAEKLGPSHLVHGLAGVLHDVKLVVHDAALGRPTEDARRVWLPHVHTRRRDPAPLQGAQFRSEELVELLLLAVRTKPQRLARLQIAHHRQELLRLSHVDLIHAHLPQHRLFPSLRPPLQIPLIDRPHRPRRQSKLARHLPRRSRLARQAHGIFEVLAEWRLARQLRNRFHLQPTLGAAHPIELHHHDGLILSPWQIPYLALPDLLDLRAAAATPRADQNLVAALSTDPELQYPRPLINLMPVHAVSRPVQNLGEFPLGQPCEFSSPVHIPAQSPFLDPVRKFLGSAACKSLPDTLPRRPASEAPAPLRLIAPFQRKTSRGRCGSEPIQCRP